MLEPGGALVFIDNHQDGLNNDGLPWPPMPARPVIDLIQRYLGPVRRAGQSVRNSFPDDEDKLRAAGFAGPHSVRVPDGRLLELTIDDRVAGNLSVSGSAPHLFGARLADFEADLRRLLAGASPSGLFSVRLPDNELKIWRPADAVAG